MPSRIAEDHQRLEDLDPPGLVVADVGEHVVTSTLALTRGPPPVAVAGPESGTAAGPPAGAAPCRRPGPPRRPRLVAADRLRRDRRSILARRPGHGLLGLPPEPPTASARRRARASRGPRRGRRRQHVGRRVVDALGDEDACRPARRPARRRRRARGARWSRPRPPRRASMPSRSASAGDSSTTCSRHGELQDRARRRPPWRPTACGTSRAAASRRTCRARRRAPCSADRLPARARRTPRPASRRPAQALAADRVERQAGEERDGVEQRLGGHRPGEDPLVEPGALGDLGEDLPAGAHAGARACRPRAPARPIAGRSRCTRPSGCTSVPSFSG